MQMQEALTEWTITYRETELVGNNREDYVSSTMQIFETRTSINKNKLGGRTKEVKILKISGIWITHSFYMKIIIQQF